MVELHSLVFTVYSKVVEQGAKAAISTGAATQEQTDAWIAEQRCRGDHDRFLLGRQSFRVEEAFGLGQIGCRVVSEMTLESMRRLSLRKFLTQLTPRRQILRP